MKCTKLSLVIIAAAVLTAAGCAATITGRMGKSPSEGNIYMADVTPEEAHRLLKEEPNAHILDVRTQAEYYFVGHPEGAINIPLQFWDENTYEWIDNPVFDTKVKIRFSKNDLIITMCRSGQRSRLAANRLAGLGFTRVYNMSESFEGGTDPNTGYRTVSGWKNRKLPYTYKMNPELMYWP